MGDSVEPEIWVVAGCLFEVSLPDGGACPWRWRNPGPDVTEKREQRVNA